MCLYGEGEHVCGCVHTTAHMCMLENNLQVHFSPSAMWVLSWTQVNGFTWQASLPSAPPHQPKRNQLKDSEDLSKSLMVLSQEVWTRVFPHSQTLSFRNSQFSTLLRFSPVLLTKSDFYSLGGLSFQHLMTHLSTKIFPQQLFFLKMCLFLTCCGCFACKIPPPNACGSHRNQNRALDPDTIAIDKRLWTAMGVPGPLEEQPVLLTAKTSR